MLLRFTWVAAIALAAGCSSSSGGSTAGDSGSTPFDGGTGTSGGAHFEIVSGTTTDPTLRCDDIGTQVTISVKDSTGADKLIFDGEDGAHVLCQYDGTHFSVIVSNDVGSLTADGEFSGATSTGANVTLRFAGTTYQTPVSPKCTIQFVCSGGGTCPDGSSLEGHFLCDEIDNPGTAKQCAVTGANPAGLSNSYFKFLNCTGF